MKTVLAGILILVALTSADKPCQIPARSVGNFEVFVYNIDKSKVDSVVAGKMYYDSAHKRMRVEGQHNGVKYVVIMHYEERVQYVLSGGHCYAMATNGSFHDMSIPSDASLVNGGRIGTSSNGLYINRYFGEKDGAKGIVTVTQNDCVMASGVSVGNKNGIKSLTYFSFTDVSLEYDDSVFDEPKNCIHIGGTRFRRSPGEFNPQQVINFF